MSVPRFNWHGCIFDDKIDQLPALKETRPHVVTLSLLTVIRFMLRDDLMHDLAVNIGESEIATGISIREFGVIEP